jgi:hypothetical protein
MVSYSMYISAIEKGDEYNSEAIIIITASCAQYYRCCYNRPVKVQQTYKVSGNVQKFSSIVMIENKTGWANLDWARKNPNKS